MKYFSNESRRKKNTNVKKQGHTSTTSSELNNIINNNNIFIAFNLYSDYRKEFLTGVDFIEFIILIAMFIIFQITKNWKTLQNNLVFEVPYTDNECKNQRKEKAMDYHYKT